MIAFSTNAPITLARADAPAQVVKSPGPTPPLWWQPTQEASKTGDTSAQVGPSVAVTPLSPDFSSSHASS